MNVITRRAGRLAAAVLLLAAAWSTSSAPVSAVTEDERSAELKLLKIINRAREAKDLRPLKEHDAIREEAEAHSERMANQQTLSHIGLDARKTRIANADSGIDPDQICENVGSADVSKISRAMKGVVKAWKQSQTHADCLFDGLGYSTRSAGAGVVFVNGTWFVTFIAAHDETP